MKVDSIIMKVSKVRLKFFFGGLRYGVEYSFTDVAQGGIDV